ncbi:MAG: TA system VapC family ribonuclease toxin [Cyanobacteriota bacterium]|nr:TA system VapC family ribonuclease toxin [Cyanobacteriota bacterium]
MSMAADLPDLNVWLALTWPEHLHHPHAVHYWEHQSADRVLFCTVTALGLVRLVCQPKLMGKAVRSTAEASTLLNDLCQQPGVSLAEPAQDGWEVFHQLLRGGALPVRLCTDAHLAALAIANGWRLVSFDRDFERFASLQTLFLP